MSVWIPYRMLSSDMEILNLFILDSLVKPLTCIFSIFIAEGFKLPALRDLGLVREKAFFSFLKGLIVTSFAWFFGFLLTPYLLYGSYTLKIEEDLLKIAVLSANFILVSGPVEEILFRGYILGQARLALGEGRLKLLAAITFSSFLFSLSHLPIHVFVWKSGFFTTLLSVFFAFVIGHLLALIYLATGNLLGAIVAHTEWNILHAFIDIEELSTFHSHGLALVVFAFVFALASLSLYYLSNQRVVAES